MCAPTVLVLKDQLSPEIASLAAVDSGATTVILIEDLSEFRRLRFHKQRIAFQFAAMRHFGKELEGKGYRVRYFPCAESVDAALREVAEKKNAGRGGPGKLRLMESAEWGLSDRYARAARNAGFEVEIVGDNLFLSDREAFREQQASKKSLLMERFYRAMRRDSGILMNGGEPAGGAWNFDRENRKPPEEGLKVPPVPRFEPDRITRGSIADVERHFPDHFGSLEEFEWPVTRKDARGFADDFFRNRLKEFGPYQDAMITGEDELFHSQLSPLINAGLLDPLELCRRAEEAYRRKQAPLNSVEGFIRQILGWREYVYQVYHLKMPEYREMNFFGAELPLPWMYWSGETRMRCMSEALRPVIRRGLNHHIQRLMITGNFALLAGVRPQEVNDWYWAAYLDSYDWVVTPNVIGMSQYADGGILGTKPYAASANYINRMSDSCTGCAFDPKKRTGENACPFNSLYWDFFARNRKKIEGNARLPFVFKNLDRFEKRELKAIRRRADDVKEKASSREGL